MGDVGSLALGGALGVISVFIKKELLLVLVGGIFVIEATTSLIQILGWKYLKRPIFPLAPIHHTFLARGWKEPKIVIRAWILGLLLGVFGLWLATM